MKTASKLYQIYLSQCQMPSGVSNQLMEFLKERLSEEDYLNAEEILHDALIQTEEEAFCSGCSYLPNLIKELMKE